MTGYTRNDTTNNIANGNVINASDLDGEFDAIQTAFDVSTGHAHDGTVGEGAPIEVLGPSQDVVVTATVIRPKTDNAVDLGSSSLEFKDLYIDGTANIDSLVADTADINGGTIDNATIATSNITVGSGKTLDVSAGTLTLADNQISGDKVEGGTINAVTINTLGSTTGNITTVNATTVDTTNIEVTTLKAKDGTSAGSIADSTGVVTLASSVLTTTDINGGTIDGAVIGGSSAAAGTFTTVTASGDVTIADKIVHSGDTNTAIRFPAADTVTVETSGAERLRITDTGNVGIGRTPVQTLDVQSSGNAIARLRSASGSSSGYYVTQPGSDTTMFALSDKALTTGGTVGTIASLFTGSSIPLIFEVSASEKMRIHSSGGVSIGNTSDGGAGVLSVNNSVIAPFAKLTANGTGSSNAGLLLDYSGVVQWQIYPETTTGSLTVVSAGTTRLKLDTSGNLGLGVTPSAWNSSYKGFQNAGGALVGVGTGEEALLHNSYIASSGNYTYTNTAAAARYSMAGGVHYWFNAPSGTAGNAITFTQAMTLNASGHLGIGTSSPSSRLDVVADSVVSVPAAGAASSHLEVGAGAYGTMIGTLGTGLGYIQQQRFDGTATTYNLAIQPNGGNVGIGLTAPTDPLHITRDISAALQSSVRLNAAYTAGGLSHGVGFSINSNAVSAGVYVTENNGPGASLLFTTSPSFSTPTNTERMRITSAGNVGIGTSSPANKLDVRTGTTGNIAAFYGTSTYHLAIEEVGGVMFLDANNGSATIGFKTNDTERMRLDSSGNLGLGVTPSAWGASGKALQITGNTALYSNNGASVLGNNFFYNGTNNLYYSSSYATLYSQTATGQHQWFTAPSGTAGNAITFTQAMTLDASGNLGLGTTSPSAKLELQGNSTVASIKYLADGGSALLSWKNSSGTTLWSIGGGIATAQDELAFVRQSTTVAKFDASGNLLVGTTAASAKLTVNSNAGGSSYISGATTNFRTGGNTNNPNGRGLVAAFNAGGVGDAANTYGASITIGASSVGVIAIQHKPGAPFAIADFFPGGTYVGDGNPPTERLRVDGSGNLLVGTTSTTPNPGVVLGSGFISTGNNAAASGHVFQYFVRSGTVIGSITQDGTTGVLYNTSSDYRLKEDVQPMVGASDRVLSLNPVNFAWKADGSRTDGFIAHEVQSVAPQAVTGVKDGEEMQAIDHSKLVPLLTAALQEALTEIAGLKARITALEA